MLGELVLTFLLTVTPLSVSASNPGCSGVAGKLGSCSSTTNTGSEVIIGGSQSSGGNPGNGDSSGGNPGSNSGPREFENPELPGASQCVIDDPTRIMGTVCPEVEVEPGIPAVTLTDLARFAPSGSTLLAEPYGVGVVGLPSNFVATSAVHTTSGTLFGHSLQVRFTPDRHRFDYGDGTVRTLPERGTTWAAAGLAQFTPTATGHAYADRGTYRTRVDVLYTAEVNFGGGWFAVPGYVTAPGPVTEVQIFEARTALVEHTCNEYPTAPGC